MTRPARQAGGFAQRIAALGARPVIFPAIVILPAADPEPLLRAHAALADFDCAIFVSANAVEYGVPDPRSWPLRLVALAPGPGTAEALASVGITDVRVPATTFDSEGLLAVAAIYRRGRGVDEMPEPLAATRQLEHDQLAHHVGLHVDIGIDEGVPYPGLGRQMHDAVEAGMALGQLQHGVAVGNIGLEEGKTLVLTQRLQPGEFQHRIVVVAEIVDADDGLAAGQQGPRDVRSDEPGDAGDEDGHKRLQPKYVT